MYKPYGFTILYKGFMYSGDLAKRGHFLQLKWNIKLCFFDLGSWLWVQKKNLAHLVMQHLEVYLHFYICKLF